MPTWQQSIPPAKADEPNGRVSNALLVYGLNLAFYWVTVPWADGSRNSWVRALRAGEGP
jgi:hypothetical protein